MNRFVLIAFAYACVLGLPFLLKKEDARIIRSPDATVVVVSPHPESIRQEFAHAFHAWYLAKTGKEVYVDFRNIGGTSEIVRFLDAQYSNSFRNYWTGTLGRRWSAEVQAAQYNHRLVLDDTPEDDTLEEQARRAFLESEVSCGIDVFFGGGSYDFIRQMQRGQFAQSGLLARHPEWFGEYPAGIPLFYSGEPFYDKKGLWFGTVLSTFGIIYNRDALRRLGIEQPPATWADLADPRFFGQLGLADPTKSGSVNKAFEMIVQYEMQQELRRTPDDEAGAVRRGWLKAMQLTQKIAANARYFTDSAQKPNIDVAMGDCAAGMAIDFYGRVQSGSVSARSGEERFIYQTPSGASTVSVDPIALLRGAPNRETAILFLEFVLSPAGQALWNFRRGVERDWQSPDGTSHTLRGPAVYELRRPPIHPHFYREELASLRTDPTVNPYREAGNFQYRAEWTSALFTERGLLFRVCFIDLQKELKAAWRALIENQFPPEALAKFSDFSRLTYDEVKGPMKEILGRKNKIEEVRLAREISEHFRRQYLEAERLARAGR